MVVFTDAIRKINKLTDNWTLDGRVVTALVKEQWEEESVHAGGYSILSSSVSIYFVSGADSENRCRVDLEQLTCTCAMYDQLVLPCRHIMAVLQHNDRAEDALRALHPAYMVSSYVAAYKGKHIE